MKTLSGDFIGFTFNNVHSSSLGILHVSNGSRFIESLLPTMQDKVVQVPGGDGSYYFGSYYTQRNFVVSIAFDSITEEQLRKIKQLFGDKKVHELIFDEAPYKIYRAKVTGMATINYVCFSEGPTHRLYKGEGEIQFTAFDPFARVKNKYLDYYIKKNHLGEPVDEHGKIINYGTTPESIAAAKKKEVPIDNRIEWEQASKLLPVQGEYDKYSISQEGTSGGFLLYNPGDIPADWSLKINFFSKIDSEKTSIPIPALQIGIGESKLELKQIEPLVNQKTKKKDEFLIIDSKTNLIEGYYTYNGDSYKSGNIYNRYVLAGSFFKIPVTEFNSDGTPIEMKMKLSAGGIENLLDANCLEYAYNLL